MTTKDAQQIKDYVNAVIDVRMMEYNVGLRDCPATRDMLTEANTRLEEAERAFIATP